jgi:hypothetical protein
MNRNGIPKSGNLQNNRFSGSQRRNIKIHCNWKGIGQYWCFDRNKPQKIFAPTGNSKWVSKSSAQSVIKILKQCRYKIRALYLFCLEWKARSSHDRWFKKSVSNWFLHPALMYITSRSVVARLSANSKLVLENLTSTKPYLFMVFNYTDHRVLECSTGKKK